jgi:hypothetical protein
MTTLTYDEIHDELYRVEEAFIRILGKKPLYVSLHPTSLPNTNLFPIACFNNLSSGAH